MQCSFPVAIINTHFWFIGTVCEFKIGDGTGGSELYLGKKSSEHECILACELKKETDHTINGVTVPVEHGGTPSCYCERIMKTRNNKRGWKSCFLTRKTYFFTSCSLH